MRSFNLIASGIFVALGISWLGIVITGHIQFGDLRVMTESYQWDKENEVFMVEVPTEGQERYPAIMDGRSRQGKDVYISLGCVVCHTQQVSRVGLNTDIARGWGIRESLARDYIRQERVLIGSQRIGSDLAHVGSRLASREQTHLLIYNPTLLDEQSLMPPYPFLYEKRKIRQGVRSSNALTFPNGYEPEEGYEIVPSMRAEALVTYLHSLKIDYQLPEMFFNQPINEK
ncbi:MAG: hypothetical protein DF168_00788 [Candidatus Moanabacter tarae]|uniref:Cytochrome c domain-containing protein n=1 Tax=Candidatus Moanibacter tarae TaxID=2200854 RepID=A0A2Z4AF64_9BACT|nr:MAG: hypothetical protein DF168_00788 [Candidatus Moanabacter tarae]|tara:strand:+ start:6912 stop:7598 length:687 start_codon:yes stop_codon:yes gene_type:complete